MSSREVFERAYHAFAALDTAVHTAPMKTLTPEESEKINQLYHSFFDGYKEMESMLYRWREFYANDLFERLLETIVLPIKTGKKETESSDVRAFYSYLARIQEVLRFGKPYAAGFGLIGPPLESWLHDLVDQTGGVSSPWAPALRDVKELCAL